MTPPHPRPSLEAIAGPVGGADTAQILPVQVTPEAGEALTEYVARVAELNLVRPSQLGLRTNELLVRHQRSIDLDVLAAWTEVSAEDLEELSVFRYGAAVTGRTIPYVRRRMWRVATQQRRCPVCPPTHRRATWDLALVLTCPEHRRLLVPAGWSDDLGEIPANDPLLSHDAQVTAALEDTDDKHTRARLRRTHRVARLTAFTADTTWPTTGSDYLDDLRTVRGWPTPGQPTPGQLTPGQLTPDRRSRTELSGVTEAGVARRSGPPAEAVWSETVGPELVWTASRTPIDPMVLAVLTFTAWRATRTAAATRELSRLAWQRLDRAGIELPRRVAKRLPPRPRSSGGPPARRPPPRPTVHPYGEDKIRLDPAAQDAADRLLQRGLRPGMVPFLLPAGDRLLPPAQEIPAAHALTALVLYLIDPENTAGLPAGGTGLRIGPHTSGHPWQTLRTTGHLEPATAGTLDRIVEELTEKPVDYRTRRTTLSTLDRIPARDLPRVGCTWPADAAQLAAGWIWADLTRGPLTRGLHPYRTIDLLDFDRALSPEQRLALHEYGHQLLRQTIDLVDSLHINSTNRDSTHPVAGDPEGSQVAG